MMSESWGPENTAARDSVVCIVLVLKSYTVGQGRVVAAAQLGDM